MGRLTPVCSQNCWISRLLQGRSAEASQDEFFRQGAVFALRRGRGSFTGSPRGDQDSAGTRPISRTNDGASSGSCGDCAPTYYPSLSQAAIRTLFCKWRSFCSEIADSIVG